MNVVHAAYGPPLSPEVAKVAAGCNVREFTEWAGRNRVAFTPTRSGGLFGDDSDSALDRVDELLTP